MGKLKVRFKCHNCSYCCTEVICLPTPWDVKLIARETGENPMDFIEFLTPEEIDEIDDSDPTWLECDDDRYIMTLKRIRKGCYFIDPLKKTCNIYDLRPILCRLFPFKLHQTQDGQFKAFSIHNDIECPKNTDDEFKTGPLYQLYLDDCEHQEEYNELVEAFNQEDHEDPTDFIGMFMDQEN